MRALRLGKLNVAVGADEHGLKRQGHLCIDAAFDLVRSEFLMPFFSEVLSHNGQFEI